MRDLLRYYEGFVGKGVEGGRKVDAVLFETREILFWVGKNVEMDLQNYKMCLIKHIGTLIINI